MKVLQLNEELEKHLNNICDAALKAGGLQVFHSVKALAEAIAESMGNNDSANV